MCFRLRSRDDVGTLFAARVEIGARIVTAPYDGPCAPGCYTVLFEDPDGIRIEARFVPGASKLAVIEDRPLEPPR